jgi:RimK family alpha-L-glutamate ligase
MDKLQAWLLYEKEDATKNKGFIELHKTAGEKLGIEISLLYAEDISTCVEDNKPSIRYQGERLKLPDVVLCRARDYLLTRQMEKMGLYVVNNSAVSEAGNHKWIAYQKVAAMSLPTIATCFCKRKGLEDRLSKASSDTKGVLKEPLVVKSVSGHGGGEVFLYEKKSQIEEILGGIGDKDAVIQPFIKGKGEDIRIYVIGNQIQGCVLRQAKRDFRSNYSLGGSISPYQLTKEEEKLVEGLFTGWYFDFAGIDFIRNEKGELLFNEIEDVVGCRMYYQCYDTDIVFTYLKYVKDRVLKFLDKL